MKSYSIFHPQRRREEFKRHIREQEEELIQQANEIEERQLRQTEEEEEEDEKRRRELDGMELFNYTPSTYPASSDLNFDLYEHGVAKGQESGMHHLQPQQPETEGMLSPVPGSTSWETELSEIELVKGSQGLGFSLLDFAVSVKYMQLRAYTIVDSFGERGMQLS